MSAKRKDNKGRVLRTGESQRNDLTYQYRYQDITGKHRTVYAPTLEELRIKEDVINKAQEAGTDYNAGNITVLELLERYSTIIKEDKHYRCYYDEFVVLLETGMRVSGMCGLTKHQLDFERCRIWVDHQLVRKPDCRYYVEKTKTDSGCRYIPMTDNVVTALKNIIANRQKPTKEWLIDGYSGFLLLDKNGNPKVAMHLEHHMQWALKKFRKLHPDVKLPKITPHVMRHTFCTNMANAGMDLKSLQYLMGHSDAGVTMNVYTHASYDHAEREMQKILQFRLPEEARKSG